MNQSDLRLYIRLSVALKQKAQRERWAFPVFLLTTLSIRNGVKLKCTSAKRKIVFGLKEMASFPRFWGLDKDLERGGTDPP
jgi:hypothetical protein